MNQVCVCSCTVKRQSRAGYSPTYKSYYNLFNNIVDDIRALKSVTVSLPGLTKQFLYDRVGCVGHRAVRCLIHLEPPLDWTNGPALDSQVRLLIQNPMLDKKPNNGPQRLLLQEIWLLLDLFLRS